MRSVELSDDSLAGFGSDVEHADRRAFLVNVQSNTAADAFRCNGLPYQGRLATAAMTKKLRTHCGL